MKSNAAVFSAQAAGEDLTTSLYHEDTIASGIGAATVERLLGTQTPRSQITRLTLRQQERHRGPRRQIMEIKLPIPRAPKTIKNLVFGT